MEDRDSKAYSWAYVSKDQVLCDTPCELIGAYLVVSAASTDSALYNGVSTSGHKIVDLECAAVTGHPFKPAEPVYCPNGLYVDVGSDVTGIFVQWRSLR